MDKQYTLLLGEYVNFKSFMKSLGFIYAGIVGNSFSIAASLNTFGTNLNLYFPINSEYITLQKNRLKVIEVQPDRLVVELVD